MLGIQFVCPKKEKKPKAEPAHLLLSLRNLPLNGGFVLIDSLDSFALVDPTETTTWTGNHLFTAALSDITP